MLFNTEERLLRKISNLFFEVIWLKEDDSSISERIKFRKELALYILFCYCNLSKSLRKEEIFLKDLRICLRNYLVDFDINLLSDILAELEIFYIYEPSISGSLKGKNLLFWEPSEDSILVLNTQYLRKRETICQKVYKYRYFLEFKLKNIELPSHRSEPASLSENSPIDLIVNLINERLFDEALFLLEDLPLEEKPVFSLLKQIALLGKYTQEYSLGFKSLRKQLTEITEEIIKFLENYRETLEEYPYDFLGLQKELKNFKKKIKKDSFLRVPYIRYKKPSRITSLLMRLKNILFNFSFLKKFN
jgi:hypothetical protein